MKKIIFTLSCICSFLFSVNAQVLYGTTSQGGINGIGTICKYESSTETLSSERSFEIDGTNPYYAKLVQAPDGKLYGTTPYGGPNGWGVIFSYDLATSVYTVVQTFNYNNVNIGAYPFGGLMLASDGKLYGMAYEGGNYGTGVIYSFDPATSVYTKLKDFDNSNDGGYPFGSLMQASDRKLYGMTYQGGTNGYGVIFSFDPSTSTYTKLTDFDNTNGGYPYGSLIQASDGKLYGMTYQGGNNGNGVIFQLTPPLRLIPN